MARLLGMCPATVYRLCERGDLPHFRVLNAIRVGPASVKRFLGDQQTQGGPAQTANPNPSEFDRAGDVCSKQDHCPAALDAPLAPRVLTHAGSIQYLCGVRP